MQAQQTLYCLYAQCTAPTRIILNVNDIVSYHSNHVSSVNQKDFQAIKASFQNTKETLRDLCRIDQNLNEMVRSMIQQILTMWADQFSQYDGMINIYRFIQPKLSTVKSLQELLSSIHDEDEGRFSSAQKNIHLLGHISTFESVIAKIDSNLNQKMNELYDILGIEMEKLQDTVNEDFESISEEALSSKKKTIIRKFNLTQFHQNPKNPTPQTSKSERDLGSTGRLSMYDTRLSLETDKTIHPNLDFYKGLRPDNYGLFIDEAHSTGNWSSVAWIFPNFFKSNFNGGSYALTEAEVTEFRNKFKVLDRYLAGLDSFMKYIGVHSQLTVIDHKAFQRAINDSSDQLKLRRILASLHTLDRPQQVRECIKYQSHLQLALYDLIYCKYDPSHAFFDISQIRPGAQVEQAKKQGRLVLKNQQLHNRETKTIQMESVKYIDNNQFIEIIRCKWVLTVDVHDSNKQQQFFNKV